MLFGFEVGDYLLHPKYGLGRFCGMEFMNLLGSGYEFAKMEYKSNTYIYVPVFNIDILKFHSPKDSDLEIEQIGSSKILRKKKKFKEDVYKVAKELAQLAAARKLLKVDSFALAHDYDAFCDTFEHQLTPSQKKAQDDIIADLIQTIPMDRLVCGDVGFGKTEIALRAAFITLRANKKVLLLAPTTILAQQHYKLCQERFLQFGFKVGVSTRFDSVNDLNDWKNGDIDILISTASNKGIKRLLRNDIGLIILDEEQHFGAKFKEEARAFGNFLQLSATPIPRTLNLALSGIKDISVLDIPPLKRKNVVMKIIYDYELENDVSIEKIIHQELENGGRVFLVVPRISFIQEVELQLAKFKKKVNYVVMHGRLKSHDVEENMRNFKSGANPVLIATNIIESGLNILQANLMIIFRPHMFGIGQLYQLRGRVGRFDSVGHIYLIAPIMLKEIAQERLQILVDHSFLGANMSLAMHDVSVRGAGSVLGTSQSGKDHGFGLEAYYDMLTAALKELGMKKVEIDEQKSVPNKQNAHKDSSLFDCTFEGFTHAFIPEDFMEEHMRLDFYKKLSKVDNAHEFEQIRAQFEYFSQDKLPIEIENFFEIIEMRYLIKQYSNQYEYQPIKRVIKKMISENKSYTLVFDKQHKFSQLAFADKFKFEVKLPPAYKINEDYRVEFALNVNLVEVLKSMTNI